MKVSPTNIPDVIVLEPVAFSDRRGYFLETWQDKTFRDANIEATFVQDNHSMSEEQVLRGLHYQVQRPQGKLVRVVTGTIFDVAVDLREKSATFGQWVGTELSDANHRMLWIPPGFAHGFYTIKGPAHFLYKCTDYYAPENERSIRWDDPTLAIAWPIPSGTQPVIGTKDSRAGRFLDAETFS